MQAIVIEDRKLLLRDVPDPEPAAGEVVVDVTAAAVNRADVLQRQGFYPPPPGAPEYPGLECAGVISAVGEGVTGYHVGERVCALLAGGGYAERVAVPAGQLLPIPAGLSLQEAAALPEVACTVWSNIVHDARLRQGEVLLVHGGGSGIGTFAIQLGKALGATVIATARAAKHERLRALGADLVIDYTDTDFVAATKEFTAKIGNVAKASAKDGGAKDGGADDRSVTESGGADDRGAEDRGAEGGGAAGAGSGGGANVVLDIVGAKYLDRNIDVLAPGGRISVIGMQGGARAELDLGKLMAKRASVASTSLRARPTADKARIVAGVLREVWPLIAAGHVKPIVQGTFPLAEAAAAQELMESNDHVGKILLLP